MIHLNRDFAKIFQGDDPYKYLGKLEGNIYRQIKTRKTLQFEFNGKSYFMKLHAGVGWSEIIKNLLQLKLPVIGAKNEWKAIQRLQDIGVATMSVVAYDERGFNPAKRESFIVTEELYNTISLEDFCRDWKNEPPKPYIRRIIIQQVATIARKLHSNGICHRDFYLCHFLLHKDASLFPKLSLIDLHRALIHKNLSPRWIVKDLAGLYYSAMGIGLSKRDFLRFARYYSNQNTGSSLRQNKGFWDQVERRATSMVKKLGPVR